MDDLVRGALIAVIQFSTHNVLDLPCDQTAFDPIVVQLREGFKFDASRTARWLGGFSGNPELAAAVADAWRCTDLPLREWAGRIARASAYHDGEAGLFGVLVRLVDVAPAVVLQQAPLSREECARALERLLDRSPSAELVDLWSAAPGLTVEPDTFLASPEFLYQPLNWLARAHYGPTWTVDDCIRADVGLPDPDRCACELAWFRRGLQTDFVVLDRELQPFAGTETNEGQFRRIGPSVEDLLRVFFTAPSEFHERVCAAVHEDTCCLDWWRPGDRAREEYDRLPLGCRVAVSCRALLRVCEDTEALGLWHEIQVVTLVCVAALLHQTRDHESTRARATRLIRGHAWLRDPVCNRDFVSGTVVTYLPVLVDAAFGVSGQLRYPDIRMVPGSTARPVYEGVMADITALRWLRQVGASKNWESLIGEFMQRPL